MGFSIWKSYAKQNRQFEIILFREFCADRRVSIYSTDRERSFYKHVSIERTFVRIRINKKALRLANIL